MKKNYNQDYIKGIKFLLEASKGEEINIRKFQWIPSVSKKLSEHNLCYRFWYNVVEQGNLYRISLCDTWYDVLHGDDCLFYWAKTSQGLDFWLSNLYNMLGVSNNDENCEEELQGMKL
jgi:hypothetical protein